MHQTFGQSSAVPVSPDYVGRAILAILLLALVGTLAELALLEHYENWKQWIPMAALVISVLVLGWQLWRPSTGSVRALRLLMVALIVAGVAGVVLHMKGNLEFERELNPGESGLTLWWEVARGATPALAPGSLIPLGLLGLLYATRKAHLLPQDS